MNKPVDYDIPILAITYRDRIVFDEIPDRFYTDYDVQYVPELSRRKGDLDCKGYYTAEHIPFEQCIWQDTLENNSFYQKRWNMVDRQGDSLINKILSKHRIAKYPTTKEEWTALLYLVKLIQIPYYGADSINFTKKIASNEPDWKRVKQIFTEPPKYSHPSSDNFQYCCYKKSYEIVHTSLPNNSIYVCVMPDIKWSELRYSSCTFFRVDFYLSKEGYLQARRTLLDPASLDTNYLSFRY